MKLTNVEKKENNQVELSILVEKEEFEAACEKSYRKNVGHINIQGFRKGKAPRKIIEKMYGPEVFYEDAMEFCYPDAYEKALEEAQIEPIDRPRLTDFDIKDGEFSFKALISVKPEVEVGKYKGLEAEKEEVKVTDDDVNLELDRLLERNSRLVTVERPAQDGDIVMIDFEGFVDGKAFDGGKGENYSLKLGSHSFIEGFEDQLVGKSAGEECDVNVTFPEEYHAKDLAGKPAVFKCKVNEVKESQKPALDDEFAKDVSEFDTLEQLKADIKEKITQQRESRSKSDFEEKLMDKMLEEFKGEIPQVMVDTQVDRIIDDFAYKLSMQGIDLNTYLKINQMELDSFRKLFADQALRQVKIRLALEKVAELEGLKVELDEIEEEIKTLAEQNRLTVERVKELLSLNTLRVDMTVRKAADFIVNNAKAKKPSAKKSTKKTAKAADAEEKKDADGEEKKPVAKKTATKKTAKKTEEGDAAEEKKPAAKKTTKKSPKAE